MEDNLRYALYNKVLAFADANNLEVIFPGIEPEDAVQNVENGETFSHPNIGEEPVYLRVNVIPLEAETKGLKTGWSRYRWTAQIDVYLRDGNSEFLASRVVDKIRDEFRPVTKLTNENDVFTQFTAVSVSPPIPTGGWSMIACRCRYSTIN